MSIDAGSLDSSTRTMILDDIPFRADLDALAKRLRLADDSPYLDDLHSLAYAAEQVARPKAMYRVSYIDWQHSSTGAGLTQDEDRVVIEGVTFTSRVLRVNLERAHRVFAYVATCGAEIQAWAHSLDDLLHQYWADAIQEMALRVASKALYEHILKHHHPGRTSTMAPGSLADWPLKEQRPLFALLGVSEDRRKGESGEADEHGDSPRWVLPIGVQLSESLLMLPTKSVSGIRFPTGESFESCQLCPRQDCPGRRAPYDAGLYEKRYSR